MQNFSFMPESM